MERKPCTPKSLKFTAQGYINITSTSNSTNNMAVKKYLTERGIRALPTEWIPDSKLSSLCLVFLFGPNVCEATMAKTTKPTATTPCMRMGIYWDKTLCSCISAIFGRQSPVIRREVTMNCYALCGSQGFFWCINSRS